jgi:hypothetical protein
MNSRLGVSKQAWEYLDFLQNKCNSANQLVIAPSPTCIGCDSLQNLISDYFDTCLNNSGSEAQMLQFIRDRLAERSLNTTTDAIKASLANCHNGWSQNVAYSKRGASWVYQGVNDQINLGSKGDDFTI